MVLVCESVRGRPNNRVGELGGGTSKGVFSVGSTSPSGSTKRMEDAGACGDASTS